MNRGKVALLVALVATVMAGPGWSIMSKCDGVLGVLGMIMFFAGIATAVASYILMPGGFLEAVKAALGIGKIGWFILPFPVDIFTGIMTTLFAVTVFMLVPIIFVGIRYVKARA